MCKAKRRDKETLSVLCHLRLYCMFTTVNGHPMQSSGLQSQSIQCDTDCPLAIISSSDQIITQQVLHRPFSSNMGLSLHVFLLLNLFNLFFAPFFFFFRVFALGGWHQVQRQWSDKTQHRDWQWIMGHSGLRWSPASNWHSSTMFRRHLPSFCTLLPPSLTCWPGPCQAELSHLLWDDQ